MKNNLGEQKGGIVPRVSHPSTLLGVMYCKRMVLSTRMDIIPGLSLQAVCFLQEDAYRQLQPEQQGLVEEALNTREEI
jgi:hypothetical protein